MSFEIETGTPYKIGEISERIDSPVIDSLYSNIREESNLKPGDQFTISNFGVFGVTIGTPIINQPNVGILGVGAIKKQAVVVESPQGDAIAIRSMMMLSLGFDHRLIDGAGGAKFIERIRYYLEKMDLRQVL